MHAPIIYDLSGIAPDTRELILATPKYRKLFTVLPEQMLRLDGSTKVIKGNKYGFRTAILYLAPHTLSGKNLCPMAAIAKCAAPCLNKAGRGIMPINQIARLRKTLFLQQYPKQAIALIKHEIALFEARSHREGWTLLVRLNGTSDRRWENDGIIQAFPNVQFYDYSKLANRKNIPSNYDLTFSYSGVPAFLPYVKTAMANGMRIAVVFRNRVMVDAMLSNNETFLGMPIVDGDDTDIRHLDPHGVAVALYAKGADAKRDNSGFIVGGRA
jgi:hypothetical protein